MATLSLRMRDDLKAKAQQLASAVSDGLKLPDRFRQSGSGIAIVIP